jgi:autotransporter passenger strand-loop-strand repeat protein
LLNDAVQSNTTISSGGALEIGSGQRLTGYAVSGGIILEAAFGGTVSNTIVSSGGTLSVLSGGVVDPTKIYAGGSEVISADGTDDAAQISGGTQLDYGLASSATVFAGSQVVESGGTASSTTVFSGAELVEPDGTADNTTVGNGGIQYVDGVASATTILNGGTEYVSAGGSTVAAIIDSGGSVIVAAGGSVDGITISGGTLELASGASVGSEDLTFAGSGGDLVLNNAFDGLVAGFGPSDGIDVVDVPYVATGLTKTTVRWTQTTSGADASGTLAVTEHGHTADITLLGQYATADFHVQSGGFGGTLVTESPAPHPHLLLDLLLLVHKT